MSKLTVVPTPVGNLEDITLRALNVLRSCDTILAEDTRTTAVLLNHYEIRKPLQSHHKFNEHQTCHSVARRIADGEWIALVSDAGTPGISDPGFMLVRACVELGVEVECLPGATAFVPALVMSGLPTDHFVFEGFLPPKKGRQTRIAELAAMKRTVVFYESPFRVVKTLQQLIEHFGADCPAAACREISKKFEEAVRGSLAELVNHFTEQPPKGEFVLVVGKSEPTPKATKE